MNLINKGTYNIQQFYKINRKFPNKFKQISKNKFEMKQNCISTKDILKKEKKLYIKKKKKYQNSFYKIYIIEKANENFNIKN